MVLIKAVVSCAGGPPAGEIGEVDDEFGAHLIEHGKALSAETLSARQGTPAGLYDDWTSGEMKDELANRGLPTSGSKAERKARLEANDLDPMPVQFGEATDEPREAIDVPADGTEVEVPAYEEIEVEDFGAEDAPTDDD